MHSPLPIYQTNSGVYLPTHLTTNHARKLNRIIDQIIQLIKLALQPTIQNNLILVDKARAHDGQDLCAFLQVVDVGDAEEREARVCFCVVLFTHKISALDFHGRGSNEGGRKGAGG